MREKYNSKYSNSINYETSYIHKYLGAELETVLNPEASSIHGVDFDSIYVNIPGLSNRLDSLKVHMDSDRCLFLTGLTGCGKTSVLNHTFRIGSRNIRIDNHSLYISISFDHAIVAREKTEIKTYFTNQIKNASDVIKKQLDEENLTINKHDLYQYIESIRPDALQNDDGIERAGEEERLSKLCQKDPFEYNALTLKYYLSVLKYINHIVLIVDDIESVGYKMELLPVDIGLSLWSCFKNQPKDVPKIWSACIVISCRHYVYRMILNHAIEDKYTIQSGINGQTLESYPIDDEINISEPVKLISIIRKRISALENREDSQRWRDAWAVVRFILVETDNRFGDFITAICINNLRKSLSVLKKVIFNKKWIQRDYVIEESTPGAFNIKSLEQFHISPPCLLRAISLGEGNTYDENSIIPNIMKNEYDVNSDLIMLIVFRAFINNSNEQSVDWRNSLDRFKLINDLKNVILKSETHPYIDLAVDELIRKRLLLRSKYQVQDDGLDINESNITSINSVYVSRGAFELWNMLGCSSVLFELFTDDIYINYRNGLFERQNRSLIDLKTFQRCIEFLSEMIDLENDFRCDAKNSGLLPKMNTLLGAEFVTKQLYKGLSASRKAYYKTSNEYESELKKLAEKIDTYKNLLRVY